MTRFLLRAAFSLGALFALPVLAQGGRDTEGINQGMKKENPSLFLECDAAVPAEIAAGIRKDLTYSDWFKLVDSGTNANYTVKVKGSGPFEVYLDGRIKSAFRLDIGGLQGGWRHHGLVDEIITRAFKGNNLMPAYYKPALCRSRIAFVANKGGVKEIYSCDLSGGELQKLTAYGTIATEPNWAPDGNHFVFTAYGRNTTNVLLRDLSGSPRLLASFPGLNSSPAVSPDGTNIAMVLSKASQVDIYTMNVSTKQFKSLTNDSNIDSSPTWSPDGKSICYVSSTVTASGSKVGRPQLRILNLTSNKVSTIANDGVERVGPDWSRDSGLIVYAKKVGGYRLCVFDPKSNTEKILTKVEASFEAPSWAPDGRHVVAASGGKLFIIDTHYEKVTPIPLSLGGCNLPAWSPLVKN